MNFVSPQTSINQSHYCLRRKHVPSMWKKWRLIVRSLRCPFSKYSWWALLYVNKKRSNNNLYRGLYTDCSVSFNTRQSPWRLKLLDTVMREMVLYRSMWEIGSLQRLSGSEVQLRNRISELQVDKQNVDIHDYNRDTGFVISTDGKIEWVKNSNKTNMKDANKNNDCC